MAQGDVTCNIITEQTIQSNLTSIFTDAIIVTNHFYISEASKNTLHLLGFTPQELTGRPLTDLSVSTSLLDDLKRELLNGFFDSGIVAVLKTKENKAITCQISGFYLGMISDLSGYIVLRVKPIDEIQQLTLELEHNREELDEFVYRAAHDLRGPLATIRGLVNLLKHQPTPDELIALTGMLDKHIETMDDRLSGLHYLSDTEEMEASINDLNSDALESTLRATLEENFPLNAIDFRFHADQSVYSDTDEHLMIGMLNNLFLYLLSLPQSNFNALSCSVKKTEHGLIINIHSQGFLASYSLMQAVRKNALLYSNAITYSQLIHYYAAQKIARKMNASLQISFFQERDQTISIVVPALSK